MDVEAPGDGTRPKVLIVEDDRALREVLSLFIAPLGYAIEVADDFDSALVTARAWRPDHVVLDLRIPGGGGLALIRPLREINPGVRVVLWTAYPSIASSVEAIKLGADEYLAKPATPEQVLAAFTPSEPAKRPSEGSIRSLQRARSDYIQMVLSSCGGSVAEAARQLGIHRQSLQRMLKKVPPET